jgi:hypothetical protein
MKIFQWSKVKAYLMLFVATGVMYSCSLDSSTDDEVSLKIGDEYQGGIIAYILQEGDPRWMPNMTHGIIAARSDQSGGIAWITGGNTQLTLNGNTLTDLRTGQANTNAMKAQTDYSGGAAKVCDDLVIEDIYDDWHLPSQDELNKLYINRAEVGGFTGQFYWSSTEFSDAKAWFQNFVDGDQDHLDKNTSGSVRAVRSF